jgi:hypothetical protein
MAKPDPNLLTQARYAASRKARGLSGGSREAVRRAVDAGRISAFGPKKMIDSELADRQWAKNTQARASTIAPTPGTGQDEGTGDLVDAAGRAESTTMDEPAPAAAEGDPQQLQADPGYQASRARQAAADARTAELKLAELEGTLVRLDHVRASLAARLAPVREGLLQIPARLAPLLAPQSDPGRIQTLLEAEIHLVLAPLARAGGMHASEGTGAA